MQFGTRIKTFVTEFCSLQSEPHENRCVDGSKLFHSFMETFHGGDRE